MSQVKEGDTIKVHYTGKLTDETVFDSSREREPLEFKVGSGQLIKGFDNAVIGLTAGEAVVANIPSAKLTVSQEKIWLCLFQKNNCHLKLSQKLV